MSSKFSSWDSYFWEPGGPVLRNLYGLRDGADLAQKEYAETTKQQTKIDAGLAPIARTYDAEHLRAIHGQLFGNVYEWAGEYRTVGIRKNLSEFAHPADISQYLSDASKLVRGSDWSGMDREQFAGKAAEVFAHVNQAHPFREGNGRASKLFLQHVSELSSYRIDYSPAVSGVTPELWNQASMLSGPDRGSYAPHPESLVPVFRAMAVERPPATPDAATSVGSPLTREETIRRAVLKPGSTVRSALQGEGKPASRPVTPPAYGAGRDVPGVER